MLTILQQNSKQHILDVTKTSVLESEMQWHCQCYKNVYKHPGHADVHNLNVRPGSLHVANHQHTGLSGSHKSNRKGL